jgi:hypothetical protein
MLIDLWERLRGYSKWVETEATIESAQKRIDSEYHDPSDPPGKNRYTWKMEDSLAWIDAAGGKHTAQFTAHEESPLFKLTAGAKLIIRCDPANPARFYSREIHNAEVRHIIRVTFTVIGVVIICVGYVFVRDVIGCSR